MCKINVTSKVKLVVALMSLVNNPIWVGRVPLILPKPMCYFKQLLIIYKSEKHKMYRNILATTNYFFQNIYSNIDL